MADIIYTDSESLATIESTEGVVSVLLSGSQTTSTIATTELNTVEHITNTADPVVIVSPVQSVTLINSIATGPQGIPGEQGETGLQGEPGVAGGTTLTYPAGEALSGHRVVVLNGEEAFYADHTDLTHAHKVVGLTTGAAILGADAMIQTGGELTEPSWTWVEDTPVWLSTNGLLTQTPPTTGFSLVVGFPITATKLFIDIKFPILLI